MKERLGDRPLAACVTAQVGNVSPADDRWTVLLDHTGTPTAALPPGGGSPPAQLVMADAGTPTDLALASPAFHQLDADTPVVVTYHGTVVGVWAGDDLVSAVIESPVALAGDAAQPGDIQLPGPIRIPEIRRHCGYVQQGQRCQHVLTVSEKPEAMPMCPTQSALADHTFVW